MQSATLKIEELEKARTFENKHFIIKSVKRTPETAHRVIVKNKLIKKTVIFFNQNKAPFRIKISPELAEKYQVKKELKQIQNKGCSPVGLYSLVNTVENNIAKLYGKDEISYWDEWKRIFAYEDIYQVAFNRGIRYERQRRKSKESLSTFDLISSEDVRELSHELGISEDKITSAVMEVLSKRKNGGKA